MKKLIISTLLLLIIASLTTSCNSKSKLQTSIETVSETKTEVAVIEEVLIEKEEIHIKYPRLVNLNSKSIEDKWNKIIEDRIMSDLELLTENDQYNLSYEVSSNSDEELSIKLMGDCYYEGAEQAFNFIYTYNISLTTGESIRLCEQTDINKLANNIYNNTGFKIQTAINKDLMDYIYSAFDNEELLAEMLFKFDYNEDNEHPYGYSFYKNEKLYLCLEVPHDLGDYIIIELDKY